MRIEDEIRSMGERAVVGARGLARCDSTAKNRILGSMAEALHSFRKEIKEANADDTKRAKAAGLGSASVDRLALSDARIDSMIRGIEEVRCLPDPVGQLISERIRPNGLCVRKVRVPLGVIGFIYESRPNVTADTAALCLKSSNAVILRGGKEAMRSNQAIVKAMQDGGEAAGLPPDAIQLIQTTDREAVRALVQLEGLVDLVIPRGGEGLIRAVVNMAKVPVLKHYKGVCHTYVDASADLEMALSVCENAKCQRPAVCNAMETLLVHEAVAAQFLPRLVERLSALGVEFRGDPQARKIVPAIAAATEDDWYAEYLDLILAVRVVGGIDGAISHIAKYGSAHSDAIIAEDDSAQRKFTDEVDSAAVLINTSTRFVDGGEFGLGAEIGISTDKLHARGPMGLEELTTYKYVVYGSGQVRG